MSFEAIQGIAWFICLCLFDVIASISVFHLLCLLPSNAYLGLGASFFIASFKLVLLWSGASVYLHLIAHIKEETPANALCSHFVQLPP